MADSDSSFLANYKNFSIAGGGGPATVLAIAAPIVLLVGIGIIFGDLTGPWVLSAVVFGVLTYSVLIWLIFTQTGLRELTGSLVRSDEETPS